MSDLIGQIFTNKKNKKLVTFVTGGDPDFATSNLIIEIIFAKIILMKITRKKI